MNTRKIGLRAHDFDRGDFVHFEKTIRKIASIGYDSIQLAPAKCLTEIENLAALNETHIHKINEILQKNQIQVSVLGCYVNFTAAKESERREAIDLFKKYIEFASLLDARMVASETTYGTIIDEDERKRCMIYVTEAMKEITELAESRAVMVAIEPVAGHALNTPELTRSLLDEVACKNLKVLYDPVNLLTPDTAALQNEMFDRAKQYFGSDIIAMHLKDFIVKNGEKQMTALGEGVMNFREILPWIKETLPEIPLVREDVILEKVSQDLDFINDRC